MSSPVRKPSEPGNGAGRAKAIAERVRRRLESTRPPNLEPYASWLLSALSATGVWLLAQTQRLAAWLGSLNWRVVLWNAITMPLIGLLYWVVNAQGIRSEFPVFARRLYQLPLPGLSRLRGYEGLHILDLAHVLAILLLGFVWYFWILVIRVWLYGEDPVKDPSLNRSSYYVFIFTLSGVMILGDATVFYCGLFDHVGSMWGETNRFVPFVATMLYMGLLAAAAKVHVHLTHQASRPVTD